ncbi:MAG TPA: hypothetical protein VFX03_14640, partial [Thermomicrobiales bacterium]|nr:hypothetical protein [Thermomicrobiales bacterium]
MNQRAEAIPALADFVFGVLERDRLSDALVAVHRAGFGPHARVIDGRRGDLAGQLRRSGLHEAIDAATLAPDLVIVVVSAPGRAALAADALLRHGARGVQALTRRAPAPAPGVAAGEAPDIAIP